MTNKPQNVLKMFLNFCLRHPNKMFRFPSIDRPIFLEKEKKKLQNHL